MHIFQSFKEHILTILHEKINSGLLPSELPLHVVTTEPPKEASHGDIATNAAMVLAKAAKIPPRQLAEIIAEELKKHPSITRVDVAGPGFINLTLHSSVWQKTLLDILDEKTGYGNSGIGKGRKVNLEYVSVNPTGPMHVGHARGAVYGDALALLLLKTGFNVTKEYYINDAGKQIDILARSVYLRYLEALGENIGTIPEGLYPGDYLIPVGEALKERYGLTLKEKLEIEWLPIVRTFATDAMMALIKNDLLALGVQHDVFTSERTLHVTGKIEQAFGDLEKKGLIYQGTLEPPKGKLPDDWEEREQTLFRSTTYGDDIDRALKKSDGSWTYFAADIAYTKDKIERGFDTLIMILGADHGGYVKRMQAATDALSGGKASLTIKLCQLVNFMHRGEPLKMSKRAGTYITVQDVLDSVGKDILRFMMLTRKNDVVMDFDLEKVREQSKDNPVFYVQYAHARAHSILRRAHDEAPAAIQEMKTPSESLLSLLSTEEELAMIRLLASWPRVVESAASHFEPHRIAFYLQEVAAAFHGFWNMGKGEKSLRFIIPENTRLSAARLVLVQAVAIVIASGLFIFNVEPVEEM